MSAFPEAFTYTCRFLSKVVCLFQGPPGPPGAQGNPGPPGEGFPGPKVSKVFKYVLGLK